MWMRLQTSTQAMLIVYKGRLVVKCCSSGSLKACMSPPPLPANLCPQALSTARSGSRFAP